MNCSFCTKTFSSKSSLKYHQKTAKYCLEIQGKKCTTFKCIYCDKILSTNQHLVEHYLICNQKAIKDSEFKYNENIQNIINRYEEKLKDKNILLTEKDNMISNLQNKLENITIKAVEKNFSQHNKNNDIQWVEDIMCDNGDEENTCYKKLKEENKDIKTQIKYLINKCVKKQPRIQYKEKYVIYILTTALMKKEGRYILGKAKDLTSRLSTYNKSDEHEVIYYQSCGSQEVMACVENMVFEYLKEYREQANRERFILPEKEEIELFSNVIKKSVEFFKK